jgi:hypothetical protein
MTGLGRASSAPVGAPVGGVMLPSGWYLVRGRWADAYYWPDWQEGEPPSVVHSRAPKTGRTRGRPARTLREDLMAVALATLASASVAAGASERAACRAIVKNIRPDEVFPPKRFHVRSEAKTQRYAERGALGPPDDKSRWEARVREKLRDQTRR